MNCLFNLMKTGGACLSLTTFHAVCTLGERLKRMNVSAENCIDLLQRMSVKMWINLLINFNIEIKREVVLFSI